jgi:chemotaxis protein CheX
VNVAYVNPFIISTINTFDMMVKSKPVAGKPAVKTEPFPSYDVSGIIGLSGDAQGCIAISFPKVVALRIVSIMLETEVKVVGNELTDGIGELANIIAGSAKQHLEGLNLTISLPNVVIGKDHILGAQKGVPTIVVPFTCSIGKFSMEVALRTKT